MGCRWDCSHELKAGHAIWNYDRAAALSDGSVKIEGVDAQVHSGRIVTEIFKMSSSPNLWTAQFMAVIAFFSRAAQIVSGCQIRLRPRRGYPFASIVRGCRGRSCAQGTTRRPDSFASVSVRQA